MVPDVPVAQTADDVLGHRDVATLLARVLVDWLPESDPLHVALYGPWGAGKSGVISLLKGEIRANAALKESVLLFDFSLWRFGAENVRRGLLLFLDGPDGLRTGMGMVGRLSETSARTEAKTRIDWSRLFWWIGASVASLIVYMLLPTPGETSTLLHQLVAKVALLGIVLPALVGAWWQLATVEIKTQITEGSTHPPPDRPDQFRAEFDRLLTEARRKNETPDGRPWGEPKKLVLVFDDLDRVPPALAWDVLTTIKTFLDAPHCVYVVPCDRDAIIDAMKAAESPNLESRAIDFLDKFFQVSFYLPEPFPREIRAISEVVRTQLGLPPEVGTIAVAGFAYTPRALKVFLNQVSLLAEFIRIRAARIGEYPDTAFLPKVAKVHAIRVLWPHCGSAIAEMPALMEILEQRSQGLVSQEKTPVSEMADRLLTPATREYCDGLREFLRGTMGIVVGKYAQSAAKLAEAIWAEGRGDLANLSVYLSTGDSDGLRRLFSESNLQEAVGVARDAFIPESQAATPEALVGWAGVLLTAFFDGKTDVSPEIVSLAIEWISSPEVMARLNRLPPEMVVQAVASSTSPQAANVGTRLISLALDEPSTPQEFTDTVLRALSVHRQLLVERHSDLGRRLRGLLKASLKSNRSQFLARIRVLSQQVTGSDWGLWWDEPLGSTAIESLTGTDPQDGDVVAFVCRAGYVPSDGERTTAVGTAIKLLQLHKASGPDNYSNMAVQLLESVALNGKPISLLTGVHIPVYAEFLKRLSDPETKLAYLLVGIRLVASGDSGVQGTFLTDCFRAVLPYFARPQMEKILASDPQSFLTTEEWVAALLGRCVELRDPDLFYQVAVSGKRPAATMTAFEAAFQADQSFGDSLAARLQQLSEPTHFARILEKRVSQAGGDVASSVRLVNLLQTLADRPQLQEGAWHSIALKLEQGSLDASDPGNASALRLGVRAPLLGWLPEPERRHLSEYATAVIRTAVAGSNDPADKTQAQVETALMLSPTCNVDQARTIANGVAHVLTRTTLPPTVVSTLIGGLTAEPRARLVDLIDDDSWDGIELTRNNRSDEGRAFLDSLLSRRPAKKQEPSKAKAKRGDG